MSGNNSNNEVESDKKEILIHGWAEIGPSATITVANEKTANSISHEEKINALKQRVNELGYNPDKFHIEVDYTERKHNQNAPHGKTQYVVYGWCEYAPSTTIKIPKENPVSSVSTSKAIDALRKELQCNGIDPKDVAVEIHEKLEK